MDCSWEDEEYEFVDAQDSIASVSDSDSISRSHETHAHGYGVDNWVSNGFLYDVWVRTPKSVQERKNQFLRFTGLNLNDENLGEHAVDIDAFTRQSDDRVMETSDAVLRTRNCENNLYNVSNSCDDSSDLSREIVSRESFSCSVENGGAKCKKEDDSSEIVRKCVDRPIKVGGTMTATMNRVKNQLLSRLRFRARAVDRCQSLRRDDEVVHKARVQRVRVQQNKKKLKELSAVYICQDIQAHKGSILTMKFSLDGHYLASAGEDGVVRIWQIVEDERSNDIDIPNVDPSCKYFTVNHLSELAPLMAEKQKIGMLRRNSDSACVIFPPNVFRILEKPVHEFHGHSGDVLDLSWSKDNLLLSSSVDETVRLWRVGSDQCLKVFPHNNYVTCVQFNPVDDNYFVSGSIDGKVRIWSASASQVVDWIDIREIVTAVTYSPYGKDGIIGTMTGFCRFFSLSDNHFQLEASVSLNGKKKSPCKRIIGFQFCPQDPSKVMVTCADSFVRVLQGINVIGKYKGQRKAGNPYCASFTSDGKHIVSAYEDSNVYVWNCHGQKVASTYQQATVKSFECFLTDASVALPWCGLKDCKNSGGIEWKIEEFLPISSPRYFSLGHKLFLDTIPKGSATWPEEKLPSSGVTSPLCRSQYNFFKSSSQSSSTCHAWGLVIVTAGWDGRIRSFINYGLPAI